jgi:hypothetical protein
VEERMKKDAESLFKKGLRSVAASVPVAASLSQWWAEMDSDIQAETVEKLQGEVRQLKNPILSSHSNAVGALKGLYSRIELTGETSLTVDEEPGAYLEVFSLWEKSGFMKGQHAMGNRWISIDVVDPIFIMAIFGAVRGDQEAHELRRSVWTMIRQAGKGVQGERIAEALKIPLAYINALFMIFEAEGKGCKLKTLGSSCFSPDLALCQ